MNNEEFILVTGATGFLGVQLVHELLDRKPYAKLALLIRDRPGQSGQQRGPAFKSIPGMSASPTAGWTPLLTSAFPRRRLA